MYNRWNIGAYSTNNPVEVVLLVDEEQLESMLARYFVFLRLNRHRPAPVEHYRDFYILCFSSRSTLVMEELELCNQSGSRSHRDKYTKQRGA